MAKHNETGQIGENIAANYLEKHGFSIKDRNYRRKWGELDITAEKGSVLHIIEVKTVSRKSLDGKFAKDINSYRPEDNMHPWKLQRLSRAIQTYILEKYRHKDPEWQFDLICVYLDTDKRVAKVKLIENLVI